MNQVNKKSIASVSLLTTGLLLSATSFAITPLANGYAPASDQAVPTTSKAKEGSCGGAMSGGKAKEGSCGGAMSGGKAKEGSCGGAMGFDMMDANKDGKVTSAECDAMHRAHFKKMDANRDGVLTRTEMASGAKSMHKSSDGTMKMKGAEGKCGGMM